MTTPFLSNTDTAPSNSPQPATPIPGFTWTDDASGEGAGGQTRTSPSTTPFKEHVRHLTSWFAKLRGCEQLLALFSLVRSLYPSYLKLFSGIVDQVTTVSFMNDTDLEKLESQANDIEYLNSLYYAPRGQMISRLLQAFPLLKAVSPAPHVNQLYVDLLLLALTGATPRESRSSSSTTNSCLSQAGDEVIQLFSLALIHPSLSQNNRCQIADLVQKQQVGQQADSQHHYQSPAHADSGLGLDSSAEPPTTPSQHRHLTRQLSLAPPCLQPSSPGYLTSPGSFESVGGTCSHPALSPQSSISSGGGCDTPAEDGHTRTSASMCSSSGVALTGSKNTFIEDGSGMKNVPAWLKSLRLHKYANLFQMLSYDEMLDITDEWLEARNVTRGARNKILVSIKRLRERDSSLQQLEVDMARGGEGSIRNCLSELRNILSSPIKPADLQGQAGEAAFGGDEGGRPGRIVDCMSKVYSQLLVARNSDDDSYAMFIQLIDSVLEQPVFTARQKNTCSSWKQNMEEFRGPPLRRFNWDIKAKKPGSVSSTPPQPSGLPWTLTGSHVPPSSGLLATCPPRHLPSAPWAPPPSSSCFGRPTGRVWGTSGAPPPLMKQHTLGGGETTPPHFVCTSRPRIKRPVERTHSAPTQYSFQGYSLLEQGMVLDGGADASFLQLNPPVCISPTDPPSTNEINRNLDLLARKVTQLAIGDSDVDDSDDS